MNAIKAGLCAALLAGVCALSLPLSVKETNALRSGTSRSEAQSLDEEIFDEEDVALRIGVMSDIHLTANGGDKKFSAALDLLERQAGGEVDALLFAGDMTDKLHASNSNNEISDFKQVLESKVDPEETAVVYALGNHDCFSSGATYDFTVTACDEWGNEEGSFTGHYTVPETVNIEDAATVTLNKDRIPLGDPAPSVTVTLGGETLQEGVHYLVSYENEGKVGTGKAVVTFIDSYEGEIKAEFTVYDPVPDEPDEPDAPVTPDDPKDPETPQGPSQGESPEKSGCGSVLIAPPAIASMLAACLAVRKKIKK